MAATAAARVERLRPEGMRSKPVYMDRVFDDPERVLNLVKARAPYRTMVDYLDHGLRNDQPVRIPWFLDRLHDDVLIANPNWFAAAREAFGVTIIRPYHVNLNINGPAPAGPPHLDLPRFRGLDETNAPTWLLSTMSQSQLFVSWLVPIASGLMWFWTGEEGGFEYWPDGPANASRRVESPMWNTGVMSDTEAMWHRVRGFGSRSAQERLANDLLASARIHWTGSRWEIRQDGTVLDVLAEAETRISLVWKAYVFRDETHLASFEDSRYDLHLATVVDIFHVDLDERGIVAPRPSDALADPDWRRLIEATYRTPFD